MPFVYNRTDYIFEPVNELCGGARGIYFCLGLTLRPYLVCASSEDSGKTVRLYRLV